MGFYNEFMDVEHGFHGVKFLCFKRAVADVHVSVNLLVCKVCRGGGGGGGDDDEDDNQDRLDSGVDVGESAAVGPVTAFTVITTYCVLLHDSQVVACTSGPLPARSWLCVEPRTCFVATVQKL